MLSFFLLFRQIHCGWCHRFFMSAGPAGADSVTAVVYAAWQRSEKATVMLSCDPVRQPKVKKPTAKLKTVVGMV